MNSRKFFWPALLLLVSCLERYDPPETKGVLSALVVDGFLNTSDNSASVRLARTARLVEKAASTTERQATVTIEEIGNTTFIPLAETQAGVYTGTGLNLNLSKKYRLHIKTKEAKNYISDDITLKEAPPIDSIYWEAEYDGVYFYVASHDPTGNSRYYLWDFVETFQHRALFYAGWRVQNGMVVAIPDAEQIYNCWTTTNSTNISIGSSKKFSDDRVHQLLLHIPRASIKTTIKYSLLVRQQVLTEESFLYWQELQKTTQNIGGLFDPLPSRVVGNVRNVADANEPVMGYVGGGSVSSKRTFVGFSEFPLYLAALYSYGYCDPEQLEGPLNRNNGAILLSNQSPYLTQFGHCVDCRADGGVNTKPDFWP